MKTITILLIAVGSLLAGLQLSGCAGYTRIPKPKDLHTDTRGANIRLFDSDDDLFIAGELLAVQADTLFVVSDERDSTMVPALGLSFMVPNTRIAAVPRWAAPRLELRVAWTTNSPATVNMWGSGLMLLTLSHGWYLLATLPTTMFWVIPRMIDASSTAFHVEAPDQELHKFARFPQGLPVGVDLSKIY